MIVFFVKAHLKSRYYSFKSAHLIYKILVAMTLIKCSIVNCGHSALEEKYTSIVGRTHFLKSTLFIK